MEVLRGRNGSNFALRVDYGLELPAGSEVSCLAEGRHAAGRFCPIGHGLTTEDCMSRFAALDPIARPTRDDLVRVQYADSASVSEYADAYSGHGPTARYHHSRRHAVEEVLRPCPGGALLDIG